MHGFTDTRPPLRVHLILQKDNDVHTRVLAVAVDYNLVLHAQVSNRSANISAGQVLVRRADSAKQVVKGAPELSSEVLKSRTGRADKSNDGGEVRVVSSRRWRDRTKCCSRWVPVAGGAGGGALTDLLRPPSQQNGVSS